LTSSWSRTAIGLEHPAHPERRRPITFDHDVARGRSDVVLAHLGHPLVRRSLALLRAEVWGTGSHLHRVTVRAADPGIGAPVAVAHGRLVITGSSGHRLHEQVIAAGIRLGGSGAERLSVEQTAAALRHARAEAAPAGLRDRLLPVLAREAEALRAALQARARDRDRTLRATLEARARKHAEDVAAVLTELAETIRREAFKETASAQGLLFTDLDVDADRRQAERDRQALRARLDAIPGEIAAEQAEIAHRYAEPQHRLFPAAVELLVPAGGRLA
jgi:hypothetical protein